MSGVAAIVGAGLAAMLAAAGRPSAPAPAGVPSGPPGRAGEVAVVASGGATELRVRGVTVARLRGPAARRLRAAAAALEPLLPPPTTVTTTGSRRAAALVVDGRRVLSITRSEARREAAPTIVLAAAWAAALREALAVPPLLLARRDLVLAPGRVERVAVQTAGTGPLALGAYDRRVVAARLDGAALEVAGVGVGGTRVPVRWGPYRALVAVSVRPPAGRVPPEVEVLVTGAPAPPDLVREAVDRAVQQAVALEPGATAARAIPALAAPLEPGAGLTVPVGVRVRSPFAGPVDATVHATVRNVPVRLADPDVLLVSNRPETITASGRLFQDTLEPGRAARLLYHHLNGTPGQVRLLKITLVNPGAVRARVHYVSGHAGPSADPLFIGFAATQRFLDALTAGRGYLVDVPAASATTFTAYTMPPLALVSGLMQFQVVEGGPVDLVVHVRVPYLLDRTVTADLGTWAFPHPRGTFPGAAVEIAREHPAHAPGAVADLGVMSGLRDIRTGEALVGDYGVLYRLHLRLTNPTDRPVTTALVASAAGGLARGLFLVNGTAVDVGLMRPYEDREIVAVEVPPGGVREISLVTMPVAGSYYPVRLILRPR